MIVSIKYPVKCGMTHWKDQLASWKTNNQFNLGYFQIPSHLCNQCKIDIETKIYPKLFLNFSKIVYSNNSQLSN